jgi:hypothetical protein
MKLEQVKRLKELEKENVRLKKAVAELTLGKLILKEAAEGILLSPAHGRRCVEHLQGKLGISEGEVLNLLENM